jgi:3-mercaptopyruvate sulfurtransferase SseA
MVTDKEWQEKAKRLLKAQLAANGVSQKQLSQLLENIGIKESPANIANKINRAGFSAAFLLQCMVAMGVKNLPMPTDQP